MVQGFQDQGHGGMRTREPPGGSTLLAGSKQCHHFNDQHNHVSTYQLYPCFDTGLWEESAVQNDLETIAESSRLPRCKTTQDLACPPHILPKANVSPLLDLHTYTATVYTYKFPDSVPDMA